MNKMTSHPDAARSALAQAQVQGQVQDPVRQLFERMFDGGLFGRAQDDSSVVTSQWAPAVDIHEEPERFVLYADLPGVDPRQAGLFHTAFLFDDKPSLAATVLRAAQDPRSRFVGSSDHLVSEAFYFTDPEGNGVELYTDRDRSTWIHDGEQIRIEVRAGHGELLAGGDSASRRVIIA